MKLCKVYYFDLESNDPISALADTLNSRDWVSTEIFDIEETEMGEWHDNIDLNKIGVTKETYEKYFTKEGK